MKARAACRSQLPLAAFALVCALAAPAYADDDDDSFQVTATVLATCEVTAQDLEFGDYDPIAASHLDASTTLSLTCTNGTPYELSMSLGGGETTASRIMYDGAEQLSYVLYRDGARTQLWGVNGGVDTLGGAGTGAPVTIDVFGRIPMQQTAPAGDYADTITVTVTW
ncbi:MAG TPA: spore coat U domain-containing protein [Terricaulis sp.]|nr:spore coat U domain-containing protein [Terricaulis sp.]HRP09909.1 spore coat U domain-containing protein [Terricaulis sp.]